MIGRIRGTIIAKQAPQLLVEIAGIGYEINAPMTTFYHLPDIGQEVALYTHLIVREDAHTLYGFHSEHDRRLFRALIKVNGVGPKLALTILSDMEPDRFVQYVLSDDSHALVGIPGIGRKTAERLIMETKDALTAWQQTLPNTQQTTINVANQAAQDAISALVTLGYKEKEAQKAVRAVQQPELNSEQLIRKALQQVMTGVA